MSYFTHIQAFHIVIQAPHPKYPVGQLPDDRLALRKSLIEEEYAELMEALDEGDLAHIGKEAADLLVVVLGTIVEYGLPFDDIWLAVHESNLKKTRGPRRADGKVLKPEGWEPPDIQRIIDKALSLKKAELEMLKLRLES